MKNKLLVIAGQTGVGKTDVAYKIAKYIKGSEIILADQIQSYKYFNISGNKPSIEYQKSIPYHNLDKYDPIEDKVNAAKFASETRRTIKDIIKKGGFPIIEGGSGFYLKMLLSGGDDSWNEEEHSRYEQGIHTHIYYNIYIFK